MLGGWGWASAAHDVTVIDDAGTVVDHWTAPHTEPGLSDAFVWLARSGRPEELPVAIEQSSGLVVDRLLAAGHPVVPSMPPPSTPPGPVGAPPGPSPTPVTATSWPTTCAPMATGCGGCAAGRGDPGAPSPGAAARGPRQGQGRGQQPARCAAGGPLAWRQAGLLPARLGDRPGLPGRLPDPTGSRPAGRGTAGGLLPAPLLPRWPQPG
jgi:hypothetical protein